MSDILIFGMKMPVACSDCPSRDVSVCVWTDDYNVESYKFSRPSFCPLHKLPEHGDLIDRDAFRAENEYYLNREFINPKYEDTLDDLLKDAPVVIPSNKEETE